MVFLAPLSGPMRFRFEGFYCIQTQPTAILKETVISTEIGRNTLMGAKATTEPDGLTRPTSTRKWKFWRPEHLTRKRSLR